MENLIWEGLEKAFVFLLVFKLAQVIYTSAVDLDSKRVLGVSVWRILSTISVWVIGLFIGSLVISGLVHFGQIEVTTVTYLFTVMLAAGAYGLYQNKRVAK